MPTVTLAPTKTALVCLGYPDDSRLLPLFNDTTLGHGSPSYPNGLAGRMTSRLWFEYDLSSIPANAIITSAVQQIQIRYYYDNYGGWTFIWQRSTDNSWTTDGITWNNEPSVVGGIQGSLDLADHDADHSHGNFPLYINLTAAVQAALASRVFDVRALSSDESVVKYLGITDYLFVKPPWIIPANQLIIVYTLQSGNPLFMAGD